MKGKLKKKHAIIIAAVASLAIIALTLGLCLHFLVFNKGTDYFNYFNDFSSSELTKATCVQNLSTGTYVYSFDPKEEIFVTARNYIESNGEEKVLYGIASAEEEYIPPAYYRVTRIFGDYAIVVRGAQITGEDAASTYVDLIRFRGDARTPYSLMSATSILYALGYEQMLVIGDYIAVYGSLEEPTSTPSYTTFYNYKSGAELLEAFRIRAGYDNNANELYKFSFGENYIAAYSSDRAYFYNVNDNPIKGYLEPVNQGSYVAFSDMEDSIDDYGRAMDVFYLGNGWFARSAMLYKTKPFNKFNLLISDTPEGNPKYARTKTDFFNVKTGNSKTVQDLFCVAGVANKYTDYYTEEAYHIGRVRIYDEETETYVYELPFSDPSSMVKDGYSLVYYYYLPYIEANKDDTTHYTAYLGETTYCILDKDLNRIQPDNTLMPTAYVDGIGWQTSDPDYTESYGTAYCYDRYMESTVLAAFVKNTATYIPYYATKDACIIRAIKSENSVSAAQYYGAVTPDGKRITDFVYTELTYFSGGYAVGTKTENGKKIYYRVNMLGEEEEITDLTDLYHGCYLYGDGKKVGVKNYAGDVLVEATECSLKIVQIAMTKYGSAMKTYACVIKDDRAQIYVLD